MSCEREYIKKLKVKDLCVKNLKAENGEIINLKTETVFSAAGASFVQNPEKFTDLTNIDTTLPSFGAIISARFEGNSFAENFTITGQIVCNDADTETLITFLNAFPLSKEDRDFPLIVGTEFDTGLSVLIFPQIRNTNLTLSYKSRTANSRIYFFEQFSSLF
jgi:hypothetical protein